MESPNSSRTILQCRKRTWAPDAKGLDQTVNWNFDILPDFIFNGLRDGAVYGAVALALVLIFKATTLINFATGELAMLGAFLCTCSTSSGAGGCGCRSWWRCS